MLVFIACTNGPPAGSLDDNAGSLESIGGGPALDESEAEAEPAPLLSEAEALPLADEPESLCGSLTASPELESKADSFDSPLV